MAATWWRWRTARPVGLALSLAASPALAGPAAVTGHDPVLGVTTTAGEGAETQPEQAARPPGGSGLALTGLGLAAGGSVTVGAVAATGSSGGGGSSSGGDSGSSNQDGKTTPPSNSGDDPGGVDGGDGANETPDDGGFDEPDRQDPGDGPSTGLRAGSGQASASFAGGGRLTVAERGTSTAWYLSQPLGTRAYATLAGGVDARRSGGFYAASPAAAELLPDPAVLGSGALQGLGRLTGGAVRLGAGPGSLRLGSYAGPGGVAAVTGYRITGPAGRVATSLARQERPAGGVLHAGTRFAARLPGGVEALAGVAARNGASPLAGRAVLGLVAAPADAEARLGLFAARQWHTGTEGGMSAHGNQSGNPQRLAEKVSVQAFTELGLGARGELGLGTRWTPARGEDPEQSATAAFVAKLTGEF